ncbi:hypothetical protein [Jannaschia pohangensis]|uniref:Uncharacterized protein n=1 Tax=Jannaschia pohangensis TaxID=390807 RepID=A0A1I3V8X8_9RHOB|nr:hypothetical protein [Jannaschia pohangensis]SFJ90826.1 hypothetical protein SAMN04488095_0099 [Jannaschia pohangensis]
MATRDTPPLYVTVGLYGIGSRALAMAFVWISLVCAVAATAYLANPIGMILVLAALWYWLAIRWMDAHDAWPKS